MDAGKLEDHIRDLRDGGWEAIEAILDRDPVAASMRRRDAQVSEDDKRTIAAAWAQFAATPAGRMALQALVDRTLNRSVFITHLNLNAEQVAIFGAHREGQNFVVQLILNQIRLALEEPTKQREQL